METTIKNSKYYRVFHNDGSYHFTTNFLEYAEDAAFFGGNTYINIKKINKKIDWNLRIR